MTTQRAGRAPARILLVDDEPAILRALRTALEASGYATTGVMTGEQAVARLGEAGFELVVLDLGLPGIDGLEVIRRVRAFDARIPIIVLSAHGDDQSKVAALDSGADDYVAKPFSMPELLARVRTGLRHAEHGAANEGTRLERGRLVLDLVGHEVTLDGAPLALTRTQFALLACFARHPNRILTHRMLAAEVWGSPDAAETENIRVFVSQLRRRLEPGPRPTMIVTEPGVGYRFVPPVRRDASGAPPPS
jgi:two-component system, OmpR family, KDP operon response regulator KdpE